MRKGKPILLSAFLLLAMLVYAQSGERYVVLPQHEATQLLRLCSRPVPKVDSGWQPSTADTDILESHLSLISNLESTAGLVGAHIAHPERYHRQYVGIVVQDRRLIYVNGFLSDKPPADWYHHVANYCDGGSKFWGAVYDPKTQQFSQLATNGIA
jgi:hypothetical protein